jgi:eukaryotic-like serine/threonine-protein kinase
MGVVYLALDRDRGTDVALKTLSRMSPGAAYRLKNEFRALADLSHPNLVSLYELVAGPDYLFFAMELVNGTSFTRHVRNRIEPMATPAGDRPTFPGPHRRNGNGVSRGDAVVRPPPRFTADEQRLRSCLAQLCEGVAFLHGQGRLHRDLKPSNVLVTPQGRVVVLDFGLVRDDSGDVDERTPDMAVVGTPTYMAPEQAMCMPLTPAADWYAVGTILFEALTGRLPFEGGAEEVLGRKRLLDAPAPGSLVEGVPADLDALCTDLLQHDPARRPDGTDILRRVRQPTHSPSRGVRRPSSVPPPAEGAFVGRGRELAVLQGAMGEVRPGRPVLVRLEGRSGMGKSTLVRRFVREVAEQAGAVVLRGRCHERESVPYKGFDQMVDALSHYLRQISTAEATALMPRDVQVLARVFPVLLRVDAVASSPRRDIEVRDDHELRRRAFAALKELFARIGDRQPLVLHIDDLQWGDVDSIELLIELLAPPDAPAMLVVCSHRSEGAEASGALRALDERMPHEGAGPLVHRLSVDPLPPDEAIDVVRTLLTRPGSLPRAGLEAIAAEAEGTPFLLEAFAQHLNEGRLEDRIHLEDVLDTRMAVLSADARRLLEVVATSGRPVPQAVAWRAARIDGDGEAVVTALRGRSLVWTQGVRGEDLMDTYHERIREHVLASLGAEALRQCHVRLATALRQEGEADHEAIAHHFDAAGDSAQAVFHAVEAARRAAEALAFDRAARLFRFALARVPKDDSRRLGLEEGLADALRNGGQGVEAGRAHVRAARLASGDRVLEHWRCAAEQLLRSGHVDEALQVAGPLLRTSGLRLPATRGRALASALWLNAKLQVRGLRYAPRTEADVPADLLRRLDTCWSVGHGLVAVNAVEAGDLVTRASLLALRAGEPGRVARALAFQAIMMVLVDLSGYDRVLEVAEEAAARSGDAYAKALVTGARGFVGFIARADMEENYRLMAEAEVVFRTLPRAANFEISTAHFQMLASMFYMGRWRDLGARFTGYVREAERRGDLYGAATLVLLYGDVPALMRDEPALGSELVESYLARWRERDGDLQLSLGLVCQIRLRVYEGRAHTILARADERVRAAQRAGLLRGTWIRALMLDGRARALVAAALELPDRHRAALLRRAAADVRRIERTGRPIGLAFADMHRGAIALAEGDTPRGLASLARAQERLAALGMHLHARCCSRVAGLAMGGAEGRSRVHDADRFMTGEGIVAPERVAYTLVPHGGSRSAG